MDDEPKKATPNFFVCPQHRLRKKGETSCENFRSFLKRLGDNENPNLKNFSWTSPVIDEKLKMEIEGFAQKIVEDIFSRRDSLLLENTQSLSVKSKFEPEIGKSDHCAFPMTDCDSVDQLVSENYRPRDNFVSMKSRTIFITWVT